MAPHDQLKEYPLSDRENEILKLLAKGYSAKLIAMKLCLSITTVISHREHLKGKLGAKNTAEMINIAWEVVYLDARNR